MDNGHTKDHNLVSDNNNQTTKPKSGSDMEDTEEFKLLRAYSQRRRPKQTQLGTGVLNGSVGANAASPPADKIQTEKDENEKGKKKKKKMTARRPLRFFTKCIRSQTKETEPLPPAARNTDVIGRSLIICDEPELQSLAVHKLEEDEDEMQDVASRLVEITDEIEFVPSDLEVDTPQEDEVERTVALILRESGDQLDERFKEANLSLELFSNYDFFRRVVEAFLERIGFRSRDPEALGPQASPKTQIAVTCEITSRLLALDNKATNGLLNYGARFLQDYYSSWAQQHGGYEAVFQGEEDEEVD